MSILLMFSVLAAAGWLVLSLVSRRSGDPGDSVAEYSRALNALAPDAASPGRSRRTRSRAVRGGAARSRPRHGAPRSRPHGAPAARRRPVRR